MQTFKTFFIESKPKIYSNASSGFITSNEKYIGSNGRIEHDTTAIKNKFLDARDAVKNGWVRWRHLPEMERGDGDQMFFHILDQPRQRTLVYNHIKNHPILYGNPDGNYGVSFYNDKERDEDVRWDSYDDILKFLKNN